MFEMINFNYEEKLEKEYKFDAGSMITEVHILDESIVGFKKLKQRFYNELKKLENVEVKNKSYFEAINKAKSDYKTLTEKENHTFRTGNAIEEGEDTKLYYKTIKYQKRGETGPYANLAKGEKLLNKENLIEVKMIEGILTDVSYRDGDEIKEVDMSCFRVHSEYAGYDTDFNAISVDVTEELLNKSVVYVK